MPKEYAQKFDRRQPSAYGDNQVATGPYMVENDESGKLTGYTPGTEIKLVRNPNWDAATDYKPAYVDSITIKEGNDPDVASRQILEGQSQVSGDFQLPAPILKSVSQGDQKDQMELSPPTGRFRYIAVRTDRPPFDNAGRAARAQRGVRQGGAAPGVRRPDHRRHPDALHPAGPAGLRGGRRRGGHRAPTSWRSPRATSSSRRST